MKVKELSRVLEQAEIAKDIYSMWLQVSFASDVKPGQFISIYTNDKSKVLPRPISICEVDTIRNAVRVVYRIAGEGTKQFSSLKEGDTIEVLGPLGNGFPLERAEGKKVMLMGGGIGIPPMLQTAKQINGEKVMVAGYRDELFLNKDFEKYCEMIIATEDGSCGTKGNVLNAVSEKNCSADVIFACGPTPMLRAIKQYASENNIECWISMEEKMACGIGACLACVCKTKEKDEHSQVHNKRICKDGPVFLASEIEL